MKCPRPIAVAVCAMAAIAGVTILLTTHDVDAAPTAPTPAPVESWLGDFFYRVEVRIDGNTYRCIEYLSHSIDCDWDHPLTTASPTATPTPTPTR